MSNTITAYFKGRIGVAESVYQNDYGIVMAFDSIDLPAHFDCYFSILNQEEAVPGIGADRMVVIPNSVLASPGTVTIHIPIHTGENDSEVEYVVYFKVIGRARPIDDGTPTQMTAIEQALALLQNPITNIEQIVNEALAFTGETFEDLQADFSVLQGQFDTAVAAVTTDTEVTDIRVGADSITDTTAGASVRRQLKKIDDHNNIMFDKIQLDHSFSKNVVAAENHNRFLGTPFVKGRTYKITITFTDFPSSDYTGGTRHFHLYTASTNSTGNEVDDVSGIDIYTPSLNTPYVFLFTASANASHLQFNSVSGAGTVAVKDKVEISSLQDGFDYSAVDSVIRYGENLGFKWGTVASPTGKTRMHSEMFPVSKGSVVEIHGDYKFKIYYYDEYGNTLTVEDNWHANFLRFSDNYFIRVLLAASNTVSSLDTYDIRNHARWVRVYGKCTYETVKRCTEAAQQIMALRRVEDERTVGGDMTHLDHKTFIMHVSDTHSDAHRWNNFVDVCNYYSPDFIAHTGDVTKLISTDDYSYFTGNLPISPMGLAIGNHDVGYQGVAAVKKSEGACTNAEVYANLTKPVSDNYGFGTSENYYYVDVNDIRFMFINDYDYDDMSDADTFINRSFIISQDQMDWFVATLQDALTNDKAVVVCSHEPDKFLALGTGDGSKFDQDETASYSGGSHNKSDEACPLCDVIEAFMTGGSVDRSYVQGSDVTITVDTSFESEGHFVTWLVGHRHGDYCGFLPTYSQYCMTVTCACCPIEKPDKAMEGSDLTRYAGSITEDAFNAIAIDTNAKTLSVVRFGANTNYLMEKRDWMVKSYIKEA